MTHIEPDKKSVIHLDDGQSIASVVYTDPTFAKRIINYFQPQFKNNSMFIDPCRGSGAFYDHLPEPKHYAEIQEGKDFMKWHISNPTDKWIISNPPWQGKVYAPFANKCLQDADNVVFLVKLFGGIGTSRRLRDMRNNNHAIKEIILVDWKDANFTYLDGSVKLGEGFLLSVIHFQRHWKEGTTWTYWQNDKKLNKRIGRAELDKKIAK